MLLYILITATAYLIYWIIYLMCSEVFMMESIVGAIIGAGGAILVGILGLIGTCIYNGRKTKKLNDNLLKLQDSYIGVKDGEMSLSKQIGVISGTDSSLSNQHKDIEKFLKEDIEFKLKQTMTYSSDAYRLIETERQLREQREKLLNCDESKLSQAIDDISAFKNRSAAEMIKLLYNIDVCRCSSCGGKMVPHLPDKHTPSVLAHMRC